jgi:hypothetical protein
MLFCPSQNAPTGGGAQQNRYQPEQDSWKIEEEISNALYIIDKPLQPRARTYLELHKRTPVETEYLRVDFGVQGDGYFVLFPAPGC